MWVVEGFYCKGFIKIKYSEAHDFKNVIVRCQCSLITPFIPCSMERQHQIGAIYQKVNKQILKMLFHIFWYISTLECATEICKKSREWLRKISGQANVRSDCFWCMIL